MRYLKLRLCAVPLLAATALFGQAPPLDREYVYFGGRAVAIEKTGGPVLAAVSAAPSAGSGFSQAFTFTFTDPAGFTNANAEVGILFNATLNGASACYVIYRPPSNTAFLVNDSGSGSTSSALGAGGATLANSQCWFDAASSSRTLSGGTLTVTLSLTFRMSFAGAKTIYLYARDGLGGDTGFVNRGSWTVPQPAQLSVISAAPAAGSGISATTFSFQFYDPLGFGSAAAQVGMLINSAVNGASACYVLYSPLSGTASLVNDSGSGSQTTSLGSGGSTIENSQCWFDARSSAAVKQGSMLTVSIRVTFKLAFTGARNLYGRALDGGSGDTGFVTKGTWTVPVPGVLSSVSVAPDKGQGMSQRFGSQYWDPAGAGDMVQAGALINSSLNGASACYMIFVPPNTMVLVNNSGSGQAGSFTIGSGGTATNSQCTISSGTGVSSGNGLTLGVNMAFTTAFQGSKNTYLLLQGGSGPAGFTQNGIWTVQ